MRIRVVTRSERAAGFKLAGLAVASVDSAADAVRAIKGWAADEDVGIVFVDAGLYRALPRELVARLDRQGLPIIVSVPDPRWDDRSEAEAYILEILRQAVGYRVRTW